MNSKQENHPAYFFLFLVFIYFICFYQLDSYCMLDWDESRVAKSSFEMYQSHEFVIVKYNGQPDLWSTKPPLLNWIQAGFIKILGLNELAVRLPSSICAAALLLFLFSFIKKYYHNLFLAYLVPIILGTSGAFYQTDHSFRSADYDGALTLFLFLGCIFLFNFLHFNPEKKSLLYLSALFFAFAVLTKGIAGFFLFPGLVIYILVSKKALTLLKNRHFYFAFLIFISIALGFYLLREMKLSGYIKAVNDMELFGRYNNTFINHSGDVDIWLNFNSLVHSRFNLYYLLIPFSIAVMAYVKNESLKQILILSNILTFSLLGVLLLSKSKNAWYDLPILPFLSINAGISLIVLIDTLSILNWDLHFKRNISQAVILTFICFFGFIPAVLRIYEPPSTKEAAYGYITVLQNYIKQHRIQKNSIYLNGLSQSQAFYFDMANEQGYNIKTGNVKEVVPGNVYIAAHTDIQQQFESTYKFDLLDEYHEVKVYRAK